MRTSKPKSSRVDQALDKADKAHEAANAGLIRTQAQSFIIGAMIGVLRDSAIIRPDGVRNIFFGAAAVIDAARPTQEGEDQKQTLDASRSVVEEMAALFGIAVPPAGQTELPRRH